MLEIASTRSTTNNIEQEVRRIIPLSATTTDHDNLQPLRRLATSSDSYHLPLYTHLLRISPPHSTSSHYPHHHSPGSPPHTSSPCPRARPRPQNPALYTPARSSDPRRPPPKPVSRGCRPRPTLRSRTSRSRRGTSAQLCRRCRIRRLGRGWC